MRVRLGQCRRVVQKSWQQGISELERKESVLFSSYCCGTVAANRILCSLNNKNDYGKLRAETMKYFSDGLQKKHGFRRMLDFEFFFN